MNIQHNFTVIIHRKWMDEEEYGRYTYTFDTYTEAMKHVQSTASSIANFLTAVNKHSAHIELFGQGLNNDRPLLFLVLESIDCSSPSETHSQA